MYSQQYFEQLDHYSLIEQIITEVLKQEEIYIGYGKDEEGWFSGISNGEIDNDQTTPALHYYSDDKVCLNISFYNEDLEKYDEFKEFIEKERLTMIPEGLHHLMRKALITKNGITIQLNQIH